MCIIKEEHKLKIIQLGLSEYIKILNLNEPIGSFKKCHLVICKSLGILSPQWCPILMQKHACLDFFGKPLTRTNSSSVSPLFS